MFRLVGHCWHLAAVVAMTLVHGIAHKDLFAILVLVREQTPHKVSEAVGIVTGHKLQTGH